MNKEAVRRTFAVVVETKGGLVRGRLIEDRGEKVLVELDRKNPKRNNVVLVDKERIKIGFGIVKTACNTCIVPALDEKKELFVSVPEGDVDEVEQEGLKANDRFVWLASSREAALECGRRFHGGVQKDILPVSVDVGKLHDSYGMMLLKPLGRDYFIVSPVDDLTRILSGRIPPSMLGDRKVSRMTKIAVKVASSELNPQLFDDTRTVADRVESAKKKIDEVNECKSDEDMLKTSFVSSRKKVPEEEVRSMVENIGEDSDLALIDASKRRQGVVYIVGGDVRTNKPPYVFKYVNGAFEDNVIAQI